MIPALKHAALTLCTALAMTGVIYAQQTTTHTNRRGDTVTDTHSRGNGQYTNDRTVTTPNGKTHTNDYTATRNANGRPVTTDTHTGRNGKSVTSTTTHGWRGNKTTVTGPNGRSRTYYRRRR
jgi:hypothetical protein